MAQKRENKVESVSVTLATGTKVTGPKAAIDKLKVEATRKAAASDKK